jgi:hypothetical protein
MPNLEAQATLQLVELSPNYCKLGLEDGSVYVHFLHNPDTRREKHDMTLKDLPVLGTPIPQQRYLSSRYSLELPGCVFQTDGDRYNLRDALDQLAAWTRPDPKTLKPPYLKLAWGGTLFPRLWLESCTIDVTHTRQGYPTRAKVDLSLVPIPDPVAAVLQPRLKLSEREREENLEALKTFLADNPGTAVGYGLTADSDLSIAEDGVVTVKEANGVRTVGRLGDIIPVRSGLGA